MKSRLYPHSKTSIVQSYLPQTLSTKIRKEKENVIITHKVIYVNVIDIMINKC